MRPVIVVALLVVGMPLSVLAPVADALEWCTGVPLVEGHVCAAHAACLHRVQAAGNESCVAGLGRVLP